jgi:hypothetical protein
MDGDWIVAPGQEYNVCGGFHICPDDLTCGSLLDASIRSQLAMSDEELYKDSAFEEFNWGITKFDTVWSSFYSVF